MLNQKNTQNAKPKQTHKTTNQHSSLRTARMCVLITVYKCHTQHSTEVMISFPLILQTSTITHMMSTGGSGYMKVNCDAIQPLRSAAPSSLIVQRLSTVGHREFPVVAACS